MVTSALTAQLPALAGALPDLFRRSDSAPIRGDEPQASATASPDASTADDQRAMTARTSEDATRMLARRAALGPLTYGRSMVPATVPAPAPMGMRGVHLDVRG